MRQRYFCRYSLFAFMHLTDKACEVALTQENAAAALQVCPYRQLVSRPMFHTRFSGFHDFLLPSPTRVSVVCPEGNSLQEVVWHLAFHFACSLNSPGFHTYIETLHQGFTSALPSSVFPWDSLLALNASSVSFVTNRDSALEFSNNTAFEDAVHDSLPDYLLQHFHFPTLSIPLVLCIKALIPMCCLLYKATSLYRFLQARLNNRVSESQPASLS